MRGVICASHNWHAIGARVLRHFRSLSLHHYPDHYQGNHSAKGTVFKVSITHATSHHVDHTIETAFHDSVESLGVEKARPSGSRGKTKKMKFPAFYFPVKQRRFAQVPSLRRASFDSLFFTFSSWTSLPLILAQGRVRQTAERNTADNEEDTSSYDAFYAPA
jgi:hypothetical protein